MAITIEELRKQALIQRTTEESQEDLEELAEGGVKVFHDIERNASNEELDTATAIKATVLHILRLHNRNPLKSQQVQAILDEKLSAEHHKTAWEALVKAIA